MKFYSLSVDEVLKLLKSNKNGLSNEVALERLRKDGKNKILDVKKKSKLSKFIDEFNNLMIIILILSAIVSFILSFINNEPFTDSIIILAIVILNAVLGFIQELKADKAIESLKKMQVTNVKIMRNHKIFVVNSEDIVKGDIILLEAGDKVPADARIIWQVALKVDESSLTGESVPVEKNVLSLPENTLISKRSNMIYSGTSIVYGKCQAVVCETGMNTEFGNIAKSIALEKDELTPLQKKINDISKFLSILIAIIVFLMFIIGINKEMQIMDIIMLSISLAVAAIPEGLPAIITITLALGMSSMAKKKAIVRKMSSVETLGSTEIICSDKTGTITQNKMKVIEVFCDNKIISIDELKSNHVLLKIMALNNDVEKNNHNYIGEPTEIALYEACETFFNIEKLRDEYKRIDEIPFDSERKMMSTINQNNDDTYIYTKGSFDSIIAQCSYILENDQIKKLTSKKKAYLKKIEKEESKKAFRVLAYACKKLSELDYKNKIMENDLVFVGMTSMIDPPREDVKMAIDKCKMAHIKPIMITGDSLDTAVSIAKEIGILNKDEEAITGEYLDKISEQDLVKKVPNYSVYARVSPLNKMAIVNAWKKNGKIVAMTGDGVNDAPALKCADVGVGMGISGTEVSKNVSDIIISDDSFSTIVVAVEEGRRIYDNIRNILVYLIAGNIAEILIVFIGMLFGIEIFLPIQLLYVNLITDSIPAISLAFEKSDKDIMKREVRKSSNTFFTPFLIAKIGVSAILKTIAVILVYFVNLKIYNIEIANTMAFLTLILLETIYAFSCKNLKNSMTNKNIFNNHYLNRGIFFLMIFQIIIFITPLKSIFKINSLSIIQGVYCFLIVLLMFVIDEFSKKIINKLFKD